MAWCHDLRHILGNDKAPKLADASPPLLNECVEGCFADVLRCSTADIDQGLGACVQTGGAAQRGRTDRAVTSSGFPGQRAEVRPAIHNDPVSTCEDTQVRSPHSAL